ncbi:MAG: tetratricopeptide repeat protein, partial [bacterium]
MQKLTVSRWFKGAMIINAVIVGCVLLCTGCSQKAKTAKHLDRAGQYFQDRKYREAAIEYMNVLKVDPTNRVAVRGMGLTLCEMGEVRAAIPNLLKAEELDLNDVDVRLKLGALYLVIGDRGRARERAEAVLKKNPDNLDALVLWGAGVSTSNEVVAAIARLSASAAKYEDQPRFYVTLASLHASKGDFSAAEEVYQKALEKIPKSWEIHLARGDLYLRKRDLPRTSEEYQAAADLSPAKSIARVKLARFRWAEGKNAEAKLILDKLIKETPQFSAAVMCRAELALSERDYDSSMKLLEGILKAEPSNLEAFLLVQRVKLAQGKEDAAIAAYEKLVSAFPKSAQGRYLLGVAWLRKGDAQKAIGECEKAVALEADHIESVRLLAELYIRIGQPDPALTLLNSFMRRHPNEGFVYGLLGAAYGAKKDLPNAVDMYRKLMKLMPENPQGPYLAGLALRRMGKDTEAAAMFDEALKLEPGFMDALEQLAGMIAAQNKNWDPAVERIERQIEKAPDSAGLHYLMGNALSQQKKWDKAETAFLKAIELKPEITAAYLGLSYVYVATHKEDQALVKLDSALAVNSNDVASLMMKGTLLMNRNDATNAAVQYQRVLAVRPSFVPALNNLACMYQGNPALKDKAYEYARRARNVAPQDPRVADTLGWIL